MFILRSHCQATQANKRSEHKKKREKGGKEVMGKVKMNRREKRGKEVMEKGKMNRLGFLGVTSYQKRQGVWRVK